MRRDAGRRRRWRLRVSDPGRPPRRAAVRRRAGCRARSRGALSRGVRDVSSHRGDVPERVSEHRRIAVLGGVYANAEALAAVLADARRRDAEAVFCLGDLGGFGAHPDRVFPLLREHDVGVVGRPENDGTPDVWYALLTTGPELEVEFVSVAYDHEAAARALEAEGLPPEFAETLRTGWWTTCLENLPARERARGRF